MGIPNVGKSTLINTLVGKAKAKVGNEPAVTKGQHRIRLEEGLYLLDTPGMLWPKILNDNSGYRLAISGAIKDTAFEHDDIACFAAEYLLENYPEQLIYSHSQVYNLKPDKKGYMWAYHSLVEDNRFILFEFSLYLK